MTFNFDSDSRFLEPSQNLNIDKNKHRIEV